MKFKLTTLALLVSILAFSQDEYQNYYSLIPNSDELELRKDSTTKALAVLIENIKNRLPEGYKLSMYHKNNYFIVEKGRDKMICDSTGKILKLPYNNDEKDRYSPIFFPSKKGTIYIIRNWNHYSEASTSENIELYDLSGNLIKKIEGVYRIVIGLGHSFPIEYITPYGNFILVYKDQKLGILDDMGILAIDTSYRDIRYNGDKYFYLYSDKGVQIYDIEKAKILEPIFEDIIYNDFISKMTANQVIAKTNGSYGIYDVVTTKWVIPAQYEDIKYLKLMFSKEEKDSPNTITLFALYTNRFAVKKDGNYGVIDANNNIVVPLMYKNIRPVQNEKNGDFENNVIGVYNKDNKWRTYDIVKKIEN